MRILRLHAYREDLQSVIRQIVRDLEDSRICEGRLFITRVLPPRGRPAGEPAGAPCLVIEEERHVKLLGVIPYIRRKTILAVRDGFYDIVNRQSRDMCVILGCRNCEAIAMTRLEEYGRRKFVTHVVYWGRNRFRPKYLVRL